VFRDRLEQIGRDAWLRVVSWANKLFASVFAAISAAYAAYPESVKAFLKQVPEWAVFPARSRVHFHQSRPEEGEVSGLAKAPPPNRLRANAFHVKPVIRPPPRANIALGKPCFRRRSQSALLPTGTRLLVARFRLSASHGASD
jgi:hypothetical protein